MYYDAHTHLNSEQLYPDREQHLDSFIEQGGAGLINVGVNHDRNLKALKITQNSKENHSEHYIKCTIGIHPGETIWGSLKMLEQIPQEISQLKHLYNQYPEHIVAIGECGIDSHFDRDDAIQERQIQLFHAQCALAQELNLPIVIHSRDNFSLTYDILKQYPTLKIYFHCRGYTPAHIQQLADTFPQLWIGFCGNLTYTKAQDLRDSFAKILEINIHRKQPISYLLETDAPYLSPQKKRGTMNTPSHLIHLYTYVSKERNIPGEELQATLKKYFLALYT